MNIKNLALIAMVATSAATVRPEEIIQTAVVTETESTVKNVTPAVQQYWNIYGHWTDKYTKYILTTIYPGALVGAFTGTTIGGLSGKLFDATVDPLAQMLIKPENFGTYAPVIALARLSAQVGSKWYWEKPLRNKLMNWIQGDIKQMNSYNISDMYNTHTETIDESLCNEECGKTLARVCAWLGLVSQIRA